MSPPQAQRLREGRRKMGFTQAMVAKKLSISVATYRGWEAENGTEPNTTARLIELCELLNMSIDWLLCGKKSHWVTAEQWKSIRHLIRSFK